MPHSVASSNSSSADSIVAQECNNVSRRLTKSDNNLTGSTTIVLTETTSSKKKKKISAETGSINCASDGRETWEKKVEFLLAVVGFAVDLGNVWRFPSTCYLNGGGAFLVPYCIMLVFGGLPLFYMELALGQYFRSGCLTVWRRVCPALKGIGYAICIIDLYVGIHYNTIIAWAVYYLGVSFSQELPWKSCNNSWNTDNCTELDDMLSLNDTANMTYVTSPAQEYYERKVLEMDKADGISDIGPVKLSLAFCVAIVFLLVYFSLWKGVKSTGKAVWFTALAPYVVLFILLIRGLTLPGASYGISYYLTPKWEKLYEPKVWIDAAIQIFFSLGPGFGTLLALSSYNKFHNNCYRDAILTSTINCLTSFLAGFVVFSVLGYMAKIQNQKIEEMSIDGFGLVFVVYPAALARMPGSNFWSIIFFLMLITLGLDSTFGGLEAVITALCDEYPRTLRRHREYFVAAFIVFLFICSLPTCTYGGTYVVNLINLYGPGISTLFIVFLEAVAVSWLYGVERFSEDIERMIGSKPNRFWKECWTVCPIFIFILFISSIVYYEKLETKNYVYPRWSINVGLLLTASSLVCIPLYIIYLFFMTPGNFKQRVQKMIKPIDSSEIIVYNPTPNYGTTV